MTVSERLLSRLRNIDWDFPGVPSESPFSAIHWHPARFASQVPSALIGLLSRPGDLVLDPFMGSGTTLVEAQRLGRRSVGIDLNPVACLVASAKTLARSPGRIERAIHRIGADARDLLGRPVLRGRGGGSVPRTVQAMWYTPRVLNDLGLLWDLASSYRGVEWTLARAAFSAVLLPVCRETRHWGYVCDNSTPRGDHERDVLLEYGSVLGRLELAYGDREADRIAACGEGSRIQRADVLCGDAREVLLSSRLPPVDLIVTSPPYFGVSDYIKSQRLSMEWLGIDLEPLRLAEIGARSKRHRVSAAEEYLYDLAVVFKAAGELLRDGGACVVIVGESLSRDSLLSRIRERLSNCGLTQVLDLNRRVSSLRRQLPSIKSEHLLVMSK